MGYAATLTLIFLAFVLAVLGPADVHPRTAGALLMRPASALQLPPPVTPLAVALARRALSLVVVHGVLIAGAVFMLLPFVLMLIDVDQAAVEIFASSSACGRSISRVENFGPRSQGAAVALPLNGVIVCAGILLVQVLVAVPCAYALAKLGFPDGRAAGAGVAGPVHPDPGAGAAALYGVRRARHPEHVLRR